MRQYTILVAEATKDILAESIAIAIRERSDVDLALNKVVLAQEVFDLLSQEVITPDVIILVGHMGELQQYSTDLLANFPGLVVARVVIGSEVVQMDLRQMDLQELILSVCDLFQRHATSLEHRSSEYKVFPNDFATNDSEVRLGLVEIRQPQTMLSRVTEWLDGVLRIYLQRSSAASNDFPGLSVSRTTIENLLQEGTKTDRFGFDNEREALDSSLMAAIDDTQATDDTLVALCKGFELTALEIQAFLICIAPELDAKYERIYGFINDDLGRRSATLSLVSLLLGNTLETRIQLAKSALFNRWRLLGKYEAAWPHGDDLLRVEPSLVSWVLGNRSAIQQSTLYQSVVTQDAWKGADWINDAEDLKLAAELRRAFSTEQSDFCWVVVQSDDPSFARAIVENSTNDFMPLLRISLADIEGLDANSIEECLTRLGWAARLTDSIAAIDASSSISIQLVRQLVSIFKDMPRACVLIVGDLIQAMDALAGYKYQVFQRISSSNSLPISVYSKAIAEFGLNLAGADIERVALSYPLPIEEIDRALRLALARGAQSEAWADQQVKVIADACRDVSCPDLPKFATALEPSFNLDDVVLPVDRRQQLNDIVSHVLYARKVLKHWGFDAQLPYGKGVAALFTGPSGTGKTMAARAIGQVLRRSVFSVDLSRVVSKYIGETEKNLDVVFQEAEKAGAILLFDEADALFGKRSEVKDAHDRYANIETAYLLQRMEAFGGLAILTSNLGQNLDQAFLRRLRFVIEFPIPDAAAREKIWRQCFPPEAPIAADLDFRFLARRIEITGGNIRQITLKAAFAAAAEGDDSLISLRHILNATRAEVLKLGMSSLARELTDLAA